MMPPLVVKLYVERFHDGRRFKLWLPLFLFWLLILPFALVTLPVVAFLLAILGHNPIGTFAACWNVLCAIPGSNLEVRDRRAFVFLHVY
jgi:hypothetical protein